MYFKIYDCFNIYNYISTFNFNISKFMTIIE